MDFAELVAAVRDGRDEVGAVVIGGGMNNRVFRVGTVCCKLYRQDDRQRDEREWRALELLADTDLTPKPLYFEPGAVVMSWIDGESLGGRSLARRDLDQLHRGLERIYATPCPADCPDVVGAPGVMIDRVRALAEEVGGESAALSEARRWLRTGDADTLRDIPLTTFGRGDPNIMNCLDVGTQIAFVDWEYSGRTARAFELADLVEHLQSRPTPDERWGEFVSMFDLDAKERSAFDCARKLLAIFFLLLLQPGQKGAAMNPPEATTKQEQRVLALLN